MKSLIERDAQDLDCYADLSEHGADVEGVTEFYPGKKPIVRISSRLTEDARLENRLRTTLTHEYGHVHFHAYLFSLNQNQGQLFQAQAPQRLISKRDNILNAPTSDWMEWQAGYACGAILMPATYVRKLASIFVASRNHYGAISPQSDNGRDIVNLIAREFQVSLDAARVRLLKLRILGQELGPSLFT